MKCNTFLIRSALAAGLLVAVLPNAAALNINLSAGAFTLTMPDTNRVVPMWGYSLDPNDPNQPYSSPGPLIVANEGDTLTITLQNNLTVATSIVIAGQNGDLTPEKFQDQLGRWRIRSFAPETAAGGSRVYTWTNLKPGTYLYQSGTHPAVQVQMGLSGALIVRPATAGQAYNDPRSAFDSEAVLLYSEVDPDLHDAVAAGTYGTPPYTSTVHYKPGYFLINGAPWSPAVAPITVSGANTRVLLRLLNAGLETHTPTALNLRGDVIAEDARVYAYSRPHSTFLLPAGKTLDVIIQPPASGTYPLYDRRNFLTNGGAATPGGMLRFLAVP
ncbi:MAG: multicopper oxidase domain-containing protein [Planctomycetota bacterium]